jgi:predicted transcriptional regulator
MTRQDVMDLLQTLPDDAPFDKIADEIEKVRFMASVDRGLKQADEGQVISHEELVAKFTRRFQG